MELFECHLMIINFCYLLKKKYCSCSNTELEGGRKGQKTFLYFQYNNELLSKFCVRK